MQGSKIFIVGANGQLGTALRAQYPDAGFADADTLDITDTASVAGYDWGKYEVIINAAAFTNVDGAETPEGRIAAWKVNAAAVGNLAKVATHHDLALVHISTDYVFDGTQDIHAEDELFSPLSVYGASKAAGDIAAASTPKHYILRTSWVIGEGNNFVRTMMSLAAKGVEPTVVADQIGRLTFTSELVRAIDFLLSDKSACGTYNVSNGGPSASWADIARKVYELSGSKGVVTDTTTADYYGDKTGIAPRPLQSTLDLAKIRSLGFTSKLWEDELRTYVEKELKK